MKERELYAASHGTFTVLDDKNIFRFEFPAKASLEEVHSGCVLTAQKIAEINERAKADAKAKAAKEKEVAEEEAKVHPSKP